MLDHAPVPAAEVAPDGRFVVLLGRDGLPPISAFARPVLGLAGYRINPANNAPASGDVFGITSLTFVDVDSGAATKVDLPQGAHVIAPAWSPDARHLAFLLLREQRVELWIADARSGEARCLAGGVNAAFGGHFEWLPDGNGFIAALTPKDRGPAPEPPLVPTGPVVRDTHGRAAPAPTYQDLLRNPTDEALFEYYFTSELAVIPLDGSAQRRFGEPGLIFDFSVAPGGKYLLQTRLHRPFSYTVPASRFPATVVVTDLAGRVVREVAHLPLRDAVRDGVTAAGTPRLIEWRSDAPDTLVWGQSIVDPPSDDAAGRGDIVYMLPAPFVREPGQLAGLAGTYGGTWWARDDLAIIVSHDRAHGVETLLAVNPSRPGAGRVLARRRYGAGRPLMTANARGQPMLQLVEHGGALVLQGSESSPEGRRSFLARMTLATGDVERFWESDPAWLESPLALVRGRTQNVLVWRERADEPPNLYVVSADGGTARALTRFPDPAPEFGRIGRRHLSYRRADGLPLGGTLYLPEGYDRERDGPLPMLMWAYPTEYADPDMVGEPTGSPKRFVRPHGVSPLFMVMHGYAVLDGFSMPIVAEKGAEPNDRYVEQLVMNAEAAVHAVVEAGFADADAIAIAGHSYGASMAANLLAHTDLFCAGIALSGAYNRTLTPFGFQFENRSYWQAPDTYLRMSPFSYVPQITEPLLLMHGSADSNNGTLPQQSDRLFAALKGSGGTARYVLLPLEGHGYHARESVLHALWEMTRWLDRYCEPGSDRSSKR